MKELLDERGKIKKEYEKEFDKYFGVIRKSIANNAMLIQIEVSPLCDYLQGKLKLSRFVYGVLMPASVDINGNKVNVNDLLNKHALYMYVSPLIKYEKNLYRIVVDFRYFKAENSAIWKGKQPLFRLRKEILNDIQIRLSSHINRLGILYLEGNAYNHY